MPKRFNSTGVCVPHKHYMVDITNKLIQMKSLIDEGSYFTMNRPRQYGKTTTLNQLANFISDEYLIIDISFEGVGDNVFSDEKTFCKTFIELLSDSLEFSHEKESNILKSYVSEINNIRDLSKAITKFVRESDSPVVLFIDEVDKSSNNQLFLSFIGMLRNKYLSREVGKDFTFKSVILAGVYDVKNLKLKLRSEEETKYNSPWNIAVDFDVDMSFNPEEIATMLINYSEDNNLQMDCEALSKEIHFFTNGYPYLVSRLCKILDDKVYCTEKQAWELSDIKTAVKILNEEVNTLFESIIKNLENNEELYDLCRRILIDNENIVYNALDPVTSTGLMFGLFRKGNDGLVISNKIFEEVVYNYMISSIRTSSKNMNLYNLKKAFIKDDGELNIERVLLRFQQFMKEQYSNKDVEFLERHGRILFLAFIKPIINGVGFDFKEVQISEEKRLDLVITYNNFKYIVEMKIWREPKYHEEGIEQLSEYLDIHSLNKGYLLVFNFNKDKEFTSNTIIFDAKEIFMVQV